MGFKVMSQVWGRYTLALLLSAVCLPGFSQETKAKTTAKTAQKSVAVQDDNVRGRLPRYFASIVDDRQRTEIYQIQIGYREKIAELQRELAELEVAQMKEMEKVLTADQRGELEKRRLGSKQRGSASKASPAKKPATSKSSTKKSASSKVDAADAQVGDAKTATSKTSSSRRSTSKASSKKPAATSASKAGS